MCRGLLCDVFSRSLAVQCWPGVTVQQGATFCCCLVDEHLRTNITRGLLGNR